MVWMNCARLLKRAAWKYMMIGPASKMRVQVGLNMKGLEATPRLLQRPRAICARSGYTWQKQPRLTRSWSPGSSGPTAARADEPGRH